MSVCKQRFGRAWPFKKREFEMVYYQNAGNIEGALAQLGERQICILEVNGSIPLCSKGYESNHIAVKRFYVL